MINILEVIPGPANHATSLYRARLPLARLQKQYPEEIMLYPYNNGNLHWDSVILYDIAFIQRPYNQHHMNVMQAFKRHNLPVWIDYDDLLSDIGRDNPAKNGYKDKEIQMIGELIHLADYVSVSTSDLKENYERRYGVTDLNKIIVIPNAWCFELFPKPPVFRDNKNIMQRGSTTHQKDLMEFSGPIIEVMNNNKDWGLDFIGYDPFFITEKLSNSSYTEGVPIDLYINMLGDFDYSVCIVPLHDSPFNRSKSNIAWQESTYAGAVCLGPDFPEWQRPGIINYTSVEDFGVKLQKIIAGEYDLKALHTQSWNYIKDNLSLSEVNKLRYQILKR